MVSNLLPKPSKKKRELNERQLSFINALLDNGGNVSAALKETGYSKSSRNYLMKSLAEEIIERAQSVLAANSIRAAESILNRVGVGRKDRVEHNVTALHGVVLLPSKVAQVEPMIINQE